MYVFIAYPETNTKGNLAIMSQDLSFERKLADPYAFALLQWPALLALLSLQQGGWQLALKIALGLWLGLMCLAAYAGRRAGRTAFGNSMLLSNGAIGLGWWVYPSPWLLACIALALLLLYTAQRALFRDNAERVDTTAE